MKHQTVISRHMWVKLGILFIIALTINIFSYFPDKVERIYAIGLYPELSSTVRMITRWIPFSIGDVIYTLLVIYLIYKLAKMGLHIYHKEYSRPRLFLFGYRTAKTLLWIYIVFKLAWGLNYDRLGIAYQLQISKKTYTKEEVTQLTNQLIDTLNVCRRQLKDSLLPIPRLDSIYSGAYRAYDDASLQFEFLNYRNRSVKTSLFTSVGDYMGFSGYYNPFTGEAQIRTDIPRVLIPYIACHEMAHQLGYASESEANFVGYLAASSSQDVYFRYSVYLDLFSYAQGEEIMLYGQGKDFAQFQQVVKQNRERLDTLVKKDRREIREFFYKRRNRVSPAVSNLYDQYLKMNKQKAGINSYNEVIAWLIDYQKKFGKI